MTKKNKLIIIISTISVVVLSVVVSLSVTLTRKGEAPTYKGITLLTNNNSDSSKDVNSENKVYFLDKNDEYTLNIKLKNESKYDISSVTISGTKYTYEQLDSSSTLDNLVIKYVAPSYGCQLNYEVQSLKYIDGKENIEMDLSKGNTTVNVSVKNDILPVVTKSDETVGSSYIDLELDVEDAGKAIKDGLTISLYKEESKITDKTLSVGNNKVKFEYLENDTTYNYVVTSSFDMFDGYGVKKYELLKGEAKTLIPSVEIVDLNSTLDTITFDISMENVDETYTLTKIELYKGTEKVQELEDLTKRSFEGLLENTEYTIQVTYKHNISKEETKEETTSASIKTKFDVDNAKTEALNAIKVETDLVADKVKADEINTNAEDEISAAETVAEIEAIKIKYIVQARALVLNEYKADALAEIKTQTNLIKDETKKTDLNTRADRELKLALTKDQVDTIKDKYIKEAKAIVESEKDENIINGYKTSALNAIKEQTKLISDETKATKINTDAKAELDAATTKAEIDAIEIKYITQAKVIIFNEAKISSKAEIKEQTDLITNKTKAEEINTKANEEINNATDLDQLKAIKDKYIKEAKAVVLDETKQKAYKEIDEAQKIYSNDEIVTAVTSAKSSISKSSSITIVNAIKNGVINKINREFTNYKNSLSSQAKELAAAKLTETTPVETKNQVDALVNKLVTDLGEAHDKVAADALFEQFKTNLAQIK